ncbi:MAG: TraR/DksA C4-type zinc finger protein [Terracoccus sp.]
MPEAPTTDQARARLADDREATTARLESLQAGFDGVVAASEGSNADDEHDPEGSTIAYERSQLSALVAQAEAHLGEIDRASERIAAGDYGRCTMCGGDIPSGRLEARPTASTCIGCATTTRWAPVSRPDGRVTTPETHRVIDNSPAGFPVF